MDTVTGQQKDVVTTLAVRTTRDRAIPKLRTDWLIPVEARMNAELDRVGFLGPSLAEHPALSNLQGLVRHLVEIGLGVSDTRSL
jgi:hypothetical protein